MGEQVHAKGTRRDHAELWCPQTEGDGLRSVKAVGEMDAAHAAPVLPS